jgi:hypothetical protein
MRSEPTIHSLETTILKYDVVLTRPTTSANFVNGNRQPPRARLVGTYVTNDARNPPKRCIALPADVAQFF